MAEDDMDNPIPMVLSPYRVWEEKNSICTTYTNASKIPTITNCGVRQNILRDLISSSWLTCLNLYCSTMHATIITTTTMPRPISILCCSVGYLGILLVILKRRGTTNLSYKIMNVEVLTMSKVAILAGRILKCVEQNPLSMVDPCSTKREIMWTNATEHKIVHNHISTSLTMNFTSSTWVMENISHVLCTVLCLSWS